MRTLIFTTTRKKDTSIGKFYRHLESELQKNNISYDIITTRDAGLSVPVIWKKLGLMDWYTCKVLTKKVHPEKYSTIFSDLEAGSYFINKNKSIIKANRIKVLNLYRSTGWNYIEGYKKTGGILNYLKAILVYITFIWMREMKTAQITSHVYTVSEYSKKNLLHNGLQPKDITVISNAIETDKFIPQDKNMLKEQLGWDKNYFYLLFVGRFSPDKGRATLLSMMKHLSDENIKLIVVDDYNYRGKLPNNIIYYGQVENKKLPDIYGAADLFVFPSLFEGDSISCREAASSGTAILGSDVGALWSLKDTHNLFKEYILPVRSASLSGLAYAAKVIKLKNNPGILKALNLRYTSWGRAKDIKENQQLYANILTKQ